MVMRSAPGPWHLPGLGGYPALKRDAIGYLMSLRERYGNLVVFWVGPHRLYLLSDADEIHRISVRDSKKYLHKTALYEGLRPILGTGLVTAGGETWAEHRRVLQPAFHKRELPRVIELFGRSAEQLVGRWTARGDEPFDLGREMRALALSNVGAAVCGHALEDTEDVNWALPTALGIIHDRLYRAVKLPLAVPTVESRTYQDAVGRISRFVDSVRLRGAAEPSSSCPSISKLLADSDLSDQHCRDEIATIVMAGLETAALTLAWLWYVLSEHPDVETRLREEALALGHVPRTIEDIEALPYTRQVVCEVLRLYPPSWWIGRSPSEPDQLCGVEVEAGAMVSMSPYVVQHHPDYWPEPEAFRPERFERPPRPGTWLPFMLGARRCAGEDFAMVELIATVATIVSSCRLELTERSPRRPVGKVQLSPDKPIWVRAVPLS
jgi:cytochrome P450